MLTRAAVLAIDAQLAAIIADVRARDALDARIDKTAAALRAQIAGWVDLALAAPRAEPCDAGDLSSRPSAATALPVVRPEEGALAPPASPDANLPEPAPAAASAEPAALSGLPPDGTALRRIYDTLVRLADEGAPLPSAAELGRLANVHGNTVSSCLGDLAERKLISVVGTYSQRVVTIVATGKTLRPNATRAERLAASKSQPFDPLAALSKDERKMYDWLVACADEGSACPSNDTICGRFGFDSPASGARLIATLETAGLIVVARGHKSRVVRVVATGKSTEAMETRTQAAAPASRPLPPPLKVGPLPGKKPPKPVLVTVRDGDPVAAHIAKHGVTKLPTAYVGESTAAIPEADRAALNAYATEQERRRQEEIAARRGR